jgi:hypothetical protein
MGVVIWWDSDAPDHASLTAATILPGRAAADRPIASLWEWGDVGASVRGSASGNDSAGASASSISVDDLIRRALAPPRNQHTDDHSREELNTLVKQDHAVRQSLMGRYDKESSTQVRQLIVSLLSNSETPEVLTFSKRLASSADITQRKDGLRMLQNLSSDVPEIHPILVKTLANENSPDVLMLALSALKPPAAGDVHSDPLVPAPDAAAIVAQLQNLTRHADPDIRLQSILQLAQWDRADSSGVQWSRALMDPSVPVRQAAVTAVAQSGMQSDALKAALIDLATDAQESKDVRGNALQVLEQFNLSQKEMAQVSQLRTQAERW